MGQRMTETEFTLDTAAELAAGEAAAVIRGRSPWYLAWRRLRRNYIAFAFLGLFVLVVVACLLAPVYASHVAHTGPNTQHVLDTVKVNGKSTPVVSVGGYLEKKSGKPCTSRGGRRLRARLGDPDRARPGSPPAAGSCSAPTRSGATSRCASSTAAAPR